MSGDYLSNRVIRPQMKIRCDLRIFSSAGAFHSALDELRVVKEKEE